MINHWVDYRQVHDTFQSTPCLQILQQRVSPSHGGEETAIVLKWVTRPRA